MLRRIFRNRDGGVGSSLSSAILPGCASLVVPLLAVTALELPAAAIDRMAAPLLGRAGGGASLFAPPAAIQRERRLERDVRPVRRVRRDRGVAPLDPSVRRLSRFRVLRRVRVRDSTRSRRRPCDRLRPVVDDRLERLADGHTALRRSRVTTTCPAAPRLRAARAQAAARGRPRPARARAAPGPVALQVPAAPTRTTTEARPMRPPTTTVRVSAATIRRARPVLPILRLRRVVAAKVREALTRGQGGSGSGGQSGTSTGDTGGSETGGGSESGGGARVERRLGLDRRGDERRRDGLG